MARGSIQTTKGAPFYWAHMDFWKQIDAIDETEYASVKPHAIALYHALLRYADGEGACFPSYEALATHIGCSRPTVIKTVRALEAIGLVRVDRSEGRDSTNRYIVIRQPAAVNGVASRVKEVSVAVNHVDCTVNGVDCLAVNDVDPNYNQELEPRELNEPLLSPSAETDDDEPRPNGDRPSRRKPETPVPEAFDLTVKHYDFGAKHHLDQHRLEIETENFLDHHRAKDSRFRDWEAAWRTWMRNVDRFGGSRSSSKPRWGDLRPGETEAQRQFRMSVI